MRKMKPIHARAPKLPVPTSRARPPSSRSFLRRWTASVALIPAVACLNPSPALAQVTALVSLGQSGLQCNDDSILAPPGRFVSVDGRYIAWASAGSNIVPGDTNGTWDIFVRDRSLGFTERVSVDSNGNQGSAISGTYGLEMSPDGRFIVFESASNNLVPGDTNGAREVFLRDRLSGTTERIALTSTGAQALGPSFYPSVSADGRFVSFTSPAFNLVSGDTNGKWDVFVRDRLNGTTERVSVSSSGGQGNDDSYKAELSADGRFVVFESLASNLVSGDTNGTPDVLVHDRQTGTTELASVSSTGIQSNGVSWYASISGDGRYVVFQSNSTNLVPSDTNGFEDIFERDRLTGTTVLVDVSTSGLQANSSAAAASVSLDGRYVSFTSSASNLAPGDVGFTGDVFVRDTLLGTTEFATLRTDGSHTTGGGGSISPDGRYVVFASDATDIVPGDTNGHTDIFLRDRFFTFFTSACDPGLANVIDCPCANPPSSPGRGCDNSSATGGAVLSATGLCHLSGDSVVFETHDERANATSILLQGTTFAPTGAIFGQGVRCAAGLLKRLYVKTAVNGAVIAPDSSAGDPTVSARSAALGDVIPGGSSRYYLVYYRDPIVLGGCFAISTFNCTQTGQIEWWP